VRSISLRSYNQSRMAPREYRHSVTVDGKHQVVLPLPDVAAGTVVDVTVRVPELERRPRVPGSAEGLMKIMPGFDDPIEGFEEYQ
jgi:hypothetical protein